jgi:hypoxanthine phosphoribosyltransferase
MICTLCPSCVRLKSYYRISRFKSGSPNSLRNFAATSLTTCTVIAVLKGAFVFLADLIRQIPGQVSLDFMAVSSYAKGTTSSGEVRLLKDLDTTLDGRNVIIVEDIVDTGLTLTYLQDILRMRNPKTLRTACLLSKPSRRQVDVKVEYIGSRSKIVSWSVMGSTTRNSIGTFHTSQWSARTLSALPP